MKFLNNVILELSKKNFVFVLIVLIHVLPFLLVSHVITLDGAAHSYNARILKALLVDESDKISSYYSINSIIVPNYIGHVIILLFNFFLPAEFSEKMLQITYVIAFWVALRYFVKSLGVKNHFSVFLASPFVYSFFFFLGFYNFLFGIIFLFITAGYWMNNFHSSFSKNYLLPLLFVATYLSHVFVFVLLNVFVLAYLFQDFVLQYIFNIHKKNFSFYAQKIILYLISSLLPIYFTNIYFSVQPSPIELSYVSFSEKIKWLYNLRPLISFNFNTEVSYSNLFLIGYVFIIFYNGFILIRRLFSNNDDSLRRTIFKNLWLIAISFILIFLLFYMYDSDGWAGYISLRLAFLVLMVWLVILISLFADVSKRIMLIITIFVLIVNAFFQTYHFKSVKNLCNEYNVVMKISDYIKPYSTISFINLHFNWMLSNLPMYVGVKSPGILLNNYEANTNYFPLVWSEKFKYKREQICFNSLSNEIINSCSYTSKSYCNDVDYLFIMGVDNEQCANMISNYLQSSYVLKHRQDHYMLFEYQSNI